MITKNFKCCGGEYTAEINDSKVENLIDLIDNCCHNNYGGRPEHPFDYIECVNLLWFISESNKEYFRNFMTNIYYNMSENFKN